jgi:hypothetical protein
MRLTGPPPLPFDQFPPLVRVAGRRLLSELWAGCFDTGFRAGQAAGFAEGLALAGALALGLALVGLVVVVVLLDQLRRRIRP